MLKPIPKRVLFSTFILFLIVSCTPQNPGSISSTTIYFPSETPLLTESPLPLETSTPEISTLPNTIATQFCMGSIAPWSCTCGDLSSEYLEVQDAGNVGKCDVIMPQRYKVTLPDNWYCHAAGVFAHNLSCVTAHGQRIWIRSVVSELPLANADESIQTFREGDGIFSEPVVEPDEERIERKILTIGQKQTLRLLTRQNDDTFALRYFIKNTESLYVFVVESEDLDELNGMTILLEDMINSVQFIK